MDELVKALDRMVRAVELQALTATLSKQPCCTRCGAFATRAVSFALLPTCPGAVMPSRTYCCDDGEHQCLIEQEGFQQGLKSDWRELSSAGAVRRFYTLLGLV